MTATTMTYIQHKLRQFTYRYKSFPVNPYFEIFDLMYQLDPSCFNNIVFCKDQNCYLHTEFVAPESQTFNGREITYFDAKRLSVFWLPGASHSGGGNGQEGQYSVYLDKASVKKGLLVELLKKGTAVKILNVRQISKHEANTAPCLAGGFVIYSAIEVELKALIKLWLTSCTNNLTSEKSALIELASKLPCDDIKSLATKLLA